MENYLINNVVKLNGCVDVDTAERLRPEKACMESEDLYCAIFENSRAAMMIVEENMEISLVNREFVKISGYLKHEIENRKKWTEFIAANDLPRMTEYHQKRWVDATTVPANYESKFITRQGNIRDINISVNRIPGNKKLVISFIDITDNKLVEEMPHTQSQYRSLTEDMEAMVCAFLPDGTLTYVNRVCCEYCQKSIDELVGHNFLDLVLDATMRQEVASNYRSLTIDQPIITHEQPIMLPDGNQSWQRWTNRAIFNGKGEIVSYQAIGIDITKHKQMENSLMESEARWQFALEGAGDGVWDWNMKTNEVFFSHKCKEMLGYEDHEFGRSVEYWDKLVYWEDKNLRHKIMEEYVNDRMPFYQNEYRLLCKDGTYKWILDRGKIVERTHEGRGLRMIGTYSDITRRKQVEAAEKEEHRQLEQIIELLPDATFVIDQQGKVIFWNKAIEEMTGIPKEKMIGRSNYDYALPFYGERRPLLIDVANMSSSEYDRLKKKFDLIREGNDTLIGEIYIPKTFRSKGAYLLGSASKLYDTSGNIIGAIESIRDITMQKKEEEELYLEKELLRTTLLSIGDGVVTTDEYGRIISINKAAERHTGWTQDEASGRPVEEVFKTINEFTRERCENSVYKVLDTGNIIESINHTILVSKEGIERPIEDTAAPIKDEDAKINGVVLIFRDITEKKERQAKIEYLSCHDQLTELYNRRYIEEEIIRVDTERNLPLTVVMGDINGLNLTNDAFGHLAGDKLLQRVAAVITKECRDDDIIARFGGDEFVILLPRTEAEAARLIVKRINEALLNETEDDIPISISFGWETKQQGSEKMEVVLKKAEDYMYRRKLSESASMRNKTVKVIIKTLYEKNEREQQHSARVSQLCAALGTALDMSGEDISEFRTVGLMHDIGKIILDDRILDKPGTLSNAQFSEVKRHAETSYRILSSVNEFAPLAEYVLAHHERWDGRGYPKGLKGTDIPLQARIIAVADAYDAMTSDRPYRKALGVDTAIEEIQNNAGTQFDPDIAKVFLANIKQWNYVLEARLNYLF